jgi:pimeloyl-ACP methyl ester carboxylesterase
VNKRRTLLGAAALAAGTVAGVALEEVLYRRVLRRPDPESNEPIGKTPGATLWVEAFDGTRIHARAYGPADAPLTLVMAHGAIETHTIWHYQVRDLLADGRYRMIAYDARGHGASGPARGPKGDTPFTEYAMCRDMVSVVRQATSGPALLVGHSMGGMTIQALWQHGEIKHIADRVRAIVLTNTSYTADLRGWRGKGSVGERAFERIEDVIQRIPRPHRLVERVRPGLSDLTLLIGRAVYGKDPSLRHITTSVRMYQQAASETLAAFVDLAHFDAYTALGLIDVPALIIAGTRDLITPAWHSEEIAARVPSSELVMLEDCGHTSPFERHDEVSAHLRKFAERALS